MKVSQLAQEFGLTADAVRFYAKEGLLKPKKIKTNGYYDYDDKERRRLRFIVSARQLGFTLADIKEILAVADTGKTPCPLVRRLIDLGPHETQKRFENTTELRQRMQAAVNEWNRKPDKAPTGTMVCHPIEEFVLVQLVCIQELVFKDRNQ